MSETIETVRIVGTEEQGGFYVINKSDLKPTDVLYVEDEDDVKDKGKGKGKGKGKE